MGRGGPRHIAAARRQVQVEPERVDLGSAGVAAPGPEVVMQMEEDSAVECRLDQLQGVGAAQARNDVGVADIQAEPNGR